ncbi:homoserine kinase [Azorhizobium sp. AG788]|uniref:homoserine kinase n=1 Tax=Azorhizobium sp. AG788 TaxID=2183897 RepID=UPI00105C2525|nr:homoserine kinase [Azorhizobium sp. AG788]TDT94417.1 homoserine kinase [Azorhizobium sp. AG788]
MAVYTDVSAASLSDYLAAYDIGTLVSYHGIAEGVENSNFLVQTTTASFILTLYEKRVDPADLPFFIGLMQHLAANGISCPQPVAMRDGTMLGTLAGRPCAIVTFLPGVSVRKPTAANCGQLGRALAQLHLAGAGFEITRRNALSVSGWRPLFEAAGQRTDTVHPGLAAIIAEELTAHEAHWPAALPAGVIHADLFPDNAFFLDDTLSGIIDFYFACNDLFAYDVAVCLNAWCFEADGAFNATKGRALLAGYQAVRPMEAAEVEALPQLARGAALRFLLTRLVDWLNVPEGALVRPKDPLEYLRKLRFHRAVASARDYGLAA